MNKSKKEQAQHFNLMFLLQPISIILFLHVFVFVVSGLLWLQFGNIKTKLINFFFSHFETDSHFRFRFNWKRKMQRSYWAQWLPWVLCWLRLLFNSNNVFKVPFALTLISFYTLLKLDYDKWGVAISIIY